MITCCDTMEDALFCVIGSLCPFAQGTVKYLNGVKSQYGKKQNTSYCKRQQYAYELLEAERGSGNPEFD